MDTATIPDEIIHQSLRLRIMAALSALPPAEALEFSRLRAITGATDGNLGAHLLTLEKAGYVAIQKDFHGRKPRTRAAMLPGGRAAFDRHVAYLRTVIDQAAPRAEAAE